MAAPTPPSSTSYASPPPPPPPPPPKPSSTAASRTTTPLNIPPPPPPPEEPFIPETILAGKSLSDLQALASSTVLLDALFDSTHPTSASTASALTTALNHNADLASSLTASAASLVQLREPAERRLLETKALERRWQEKEKEMYQALQRFSSPALYVQLVNALGDAEATGEGMAGSFLEGEKDSGGEVEFVKEYRQIRRTVHLRKERRERWDEGRVGGWR